MAATISRSLIKLLIWVVLLGQLMLWVMMPTKTYLDTWWNSMFEKLRTTYFDFRVSAILLYTFPVLFVSVLGCFYLHLGEIKSSNDYKLESNVKKNRLAVWRKPMLVKGPLGIVSGVEVALLLMFIALLIWSLIMWMHYLFDKHSTDPKARQEKVWEFKLEEASLALGIVGSICLAFLFFPVSRGSSVLPLFGLTAESSIKYHIWLGHMAMLLLTAHGIGYIIYWAVTDQITEMVKWSKTEISNVAGELSLLAGLGIWATTFPQIRRKMFELFFYTHYLYILFMVFFFFHVGVYYYMLPGFYLFMIDRYLRFLQSRQNVRVVSARILPCDTLELNFSKTPGLSYSPTSILFMNVPSLSKLQWHPFTISSSSNLEQDTLSVIIKVEGTWTKKLYQMLSSPNSLIDHLEVSVEGPYGPTSTHFLRHDTLVMVSGGSGIAPFISIIRELIFASTVHKCRTPQVILISAFKYSADLTILDLLLPISGTSSTLSNLQLKIDAFVTREKQPTLENSKLLRTVWFKPKATDEPITAILGPKSWLWLATIVAFSFMIFLIIIGLITRYYIYPIDHNTYMVFSLALKVFLTMLVLCVSIAMTATVIVLWNKKQNAREVKQIQNLESSTLDTAPNSSRFYNVDRELESVPHKSLAQSTNVHYGVRPDLKKMLFECKGSSVGVLVCGPKKMRHEVAAICSSGLAVNLQFESISFSW